MHLADSLTSNHPLPSYRDLCPVNVDAALRFAREWAAAAAGLPAQPRQVQVVCRRQGWGMLQRDQSMVNQPLRLAGRVFAHGIGTHADSEIVLSASQPIRALRAWVGMDDNDTIRAHSEKSPRLVFTVIESGRELWRSPVVGVNSEPVRADVNVGGVRELVLRVHEVNGNVQFTHADWADVELELADGSRAAVKSDGGAFAGQSLPLVQPPFSFLYGGRASGDLLPAWRVSREAQASPEGGQQHRVTWLDPETGLECILDLQSFGDFPAVEWVLRFRNTGPSNAPLLETIRPLDTTWNSEAEARLRRSRGAPSSPSDFQYLVEPLPSGTTIAMAAGGGRSSNAWLPFFNLQTGGTGVITAIGWSGQWSAEYACKEKEVHLQAGQELTRLSLNPGEEIRTPRILMLFWDGDPQAGHNLLRRFILAHHTPRPNGQLLRGPLTVAHWGGMKTAEHLTRIETYRKQDLGYEYYWIDAGWYGPSDSYSPDEFTGDWAKHVGNWNINPVAHPKGLRPISDAAAAAGMKFLLWFEPERAVSGTPLTIEHPEWFLGSPKPGADVLFDLGNPEARRWLTDFMSNFMKEQGVRLYRQDFNFDPLPYWRAADPPDRQGITEIRHVVGLYDFWDELLRRQPGLVIDNCASGGRRIDLETISRSIPLWRSDWQCGWINDATPGQTHTMGLSYWVPLSATGVLGAARRAGDTYNFRSTLSAGIQFGIFPYESFPIQDDYPWDWHRRMLADFRRAQPFFYGDYYPLTPCTAEMGALVAYQMHRPDMGQGMLLAFRRAQSPFVTADFRIEGLEPEADYELQDADSGRLWRQSGRELQERGVRVTLETLPASCLVFYLKRPCP